jgi:hypothetical protein
VCYEVQVICRRNRAVCVYHATLRWNAFQWRHLPHWDRIECCLSSAGRRCRILTCQTRLVQGQGRPCGFQTWKGGTHWHTSRKGTSVIGTGVVRLNGHPPMVLFGEKQTGSQAGPLACIQAHSNGARWPVRRASCTPATGPMIQGTPPTSPLRWRSHLCAASRSRLTNAGL